MDFTCTLFDKEASVEWFRPRISTRNVASVFPSRPRYVLIDTTADNLMLVPASDGFFNDLEKGHVYLVPAVKEASLASSSGSSAAAAAAAAAMSGAATSQQGERMTASAVTLTASSSSSSSLQTNLSASNGGSSSASTTPTVEKKSATLKGSIFKDAKEKMMRKKKDTPTSSSNSLKRRSGTSLAVEDVVDRRRSSTTGLSNEVSFVQMRSLIAQAEDGSSGTSPMSSAESESFPGVRMNHVVPGERSSSSSSSSNEVKVEVLKECMAAGPLSPDCREGDVLVALRCDLDGNVEVMIRGKPHLVPLNCIQPVPIDNPSTEQKQLLREIAERSKRLGTGSIKQKVPARKESVLGALRTKMRGGDSSEGSQNSTPPTVSVLSSSNPSLEVDLDEKLDPRSVYGKPLAMNEMPIPGPVRKCVEFFRRKDHIKFEGIFRVPGSSNAVMRIRNKFLVASGSGNVDISDDENPTVVASALKTFLFELPEALIPSEHWYRLMEITDNRDFCLEDAHALIDELPEENVGVLHYLFDFLAQVSEFASDNKMTPANLGMVFGIVLIKPPDSNVSNVGSSMPKEICTFFVENVDDIFDNDDSTDE